VTTTISASSPTGIILSGASVILGGVTINPSGARATAVYATGGGVPLWNDGALLAEGGGGYGVNLNNGGPFTNAGGGVVIGANIGVELGGTGTRAYIYNAGTIAGGYGAALEGHFGTIVNSGNIAGTKSSGFGVQMGFGGTLTNEVGGTISGGLAGVYGGSGNNIVDIVVNSGLISGSVGDGISLAPVSHVTNESQGSITGRATGLYVYNGTVTNDGAITANRFAVSFGGVGTVGNPNRLVLGPDSQLTGSVALGGYSVLELEAGSSSLGGLGSSIVGASTVAFDTGAQWTLTGVNLAGFSGVVTGFAHGDEIVVPNAYVASYGFVGDVLELTSTAAVTTDLTLAGAPPVHVTEYAGNATITSIACLVAGTAVLTPSGEVAVETLREGDPIVTPSGVARLRWAGRTVVPLSRHPRPEEAAPIYFEAGAIAPGVPHRALRLSPDHALFLDGVLVQAQALVNGASIRREVSSRDIAYHHLELDRHDLMFAEGAACETYLDTGNRGVFDGEAGVRPLHADFSAGHDGGGACGPLLLTGPSLAARHRRLRERARRLGYVLSCAAELEIVGSGGVLRLTPCGRGRWRVALRGDGGMLRLCSRTWVPEQLDRGSDDRRTLGVAVTGIRLDGVDVALDDARLGPGWHAPEQAAARRWRWTDGAAVLDVGSARELEISLRGGGAAYWLSTGRRMARAA
jgi:hypothetical protein